MRLFDCRKSLEKLERRHDGAPDGPSRMVRECLRLRRVPLKDFTVENLRVMIDQQLGLRHLIPLAVEALADNPLAAGDFYPGDLLKVVLTIDPRFWAQHRDLQGKVDGITARAFVRIATVADADKETQFAATERVLQEAYAEFRYGIPEAAASTAMTV